MPCFSFRRIVIRRSFAVIGAALLAAVIFAIPAVAKPTPQGGTVVLDQASPSLGDTVTFTWTATGLRPGQVPRIQIVCTQDSVVTFAVADSADASFVLGGGSSAWKATGGPAGCVVTLYYWDWKPVQRFVPLANTSFTAGG